MRLTLLHTPQPITLDPFEKFKEWKILVETQTNRKVRKLRTDNGLEFYSKEFNQFCIKQGIERHKTIWGTPQQNGLAERMSQTIMEMVKCIISSANYSTHFWDEAVMVITYLISRSPSTAIEMKTPEESGVVTLQILDI